MKKVFTTLLLAFIFIPNVVFATVQVYDRHVLFSYGLSDVEVIKEGIGEQMDDAIVLSVPDTSQIKINNNIWVSKEPNKILLQPGTAETNSYDFWKVTGTYKDKNFFLVGYTIENGGDTWFERNSLTLDIIKCGVVFLIIGTLLLVLKRKKKTESF